ncbi:MAG: hypothetical protein ABEJ31_01565 [Haloarculaceae archaeon]
METDDERRFLDEDEIDENERLREDVDTTDDAVPSASGWGWGMEWPPIYRREDDEYAGERPAAAADDDGWWDEGLISLTLLVGVALFLFPEPATSVLGIALIFLGGFAWVVDALA